MNPFADAADLYLPDNWCNWDYDQDVLSTDWESFDEELHTPEEDEDDWS